MKKIKSNLLIALGILVGVFLFPTTLLLSVGMIPTFVAYIVNRKTQKIRTYCVGMMNLGGCVPFVVDTWARGHTIDTALNHVFDPQAIVIMYFAAAIGYMIDWSISGIIASVITQKAQLRLEQIDKIQAEMIERWSEDVTNGIPIDTPVTEDKTPQKQIPQMTSGH